jgi:hypothetical protein
LETGEILRASEDYQGKEWFSNIAITPASDQSHYKSAEEAWYAKVCNFHELLISLPRDSNFGFLQKILLLLKFFPRSHKEPYDLALVCWFDVHPKETEIYGYPQLVYTKEYNTIPISSIDKEVHIVPRFDKKNRYLLNKYIF